MAEETTQELIFQGTQAAPADFSSLEEKIFQLIQMLKETRDAKLLAELELEQSKEQMQTREAELAALKGEVNDLRREREEVKGRVDKMLHSVDEILASADEQ